VLEWMADHGVSLPLCRLGLPDHFVEHGSVGELRHIVGIDTEGIKMAILKSYRQSAATPDQTDRKA